MQTGGDVYSTEALLNVSIFYIGQKTDNSTALSLKIKENITERQSLIKKGHVKKCQLRTKHQARRDKTGSSFVSLVVVLERSFFYSPSEFLHSIHCRQLSVIVGDMLSILFLRLLPKRLATDL